MNFEYPTFFFSFLEVAFQGLANLGSSRHALVIACFRESQLLSSKMFSGVSVWDASLVQPLVSFVLTLPSSLPGWCLLIPTGNICCSDVSWLTFIYNKSVAVLMVEAKVIKSMTRLTPLWNTLASLPPWWSCLLSDYQMYLQRVFRDFYKCIYS